jgi:hypothetical protein
VITKLVLLLLFKFSISSSVQMSAGTGSLPMSPFVDLINCQTESSNWRITHVEIPSVLR